MDADDPGSAAAFAEISRELLDHPEQADTSQRVVDRAVEVIPAADHCTITIRRARNRFDTVATTSELAQQADELQYTLEEGPCLDAVVDDECYLIRDTETEPRWPRWGPGVAELGLRSILGIQLSTETETLGALNFYADKPDAFDADNVDTALIYAAHAAGAVNAHNMVSGLQTAMNSRHLIGVAQGRLMQRYDISLEVSFEVLRRYSSHANIKLRQVARMVVETGELPADYPDLLGPPDAH